MGSTERYDWRSSEKPESIGEKLSREAHLLMSLKDTFVPELTGKSKYVDLDANSDPFRLDDSEAIRMFLSAGISTVGGALGLALRFKGAAPAVAAMAGIGVALDVMVRAAPILYDAWNDRDNEYNDEGRLAKQAVQGVWDVASLVGGIGFGYGFGKLTGFENIPPGAISGGGGGTTLPMGFPIVRI